MPHSTGAVVEEGGSGGEGAARRGQPLIRGPQGREDGWGGSYRGPSTRLWSRVKGGHTEVGQGAKKGAGQEAEEAARP